MGNLQGELANKLNVPIPKKNHKRGGASNSTERVPEKIKYFKDDNKEVINDSLLDKKASELAGQLTNLATSQMRKFYDEVKNIQMRLDTDEKQGKVRTDEFRKLKPLLKMLKSKVVYAKSRLKEKMPQAFVDFIHDNVDSIADDRDFDVFALYFEAVVGYKQEKRR